MSELVQANVIITGQVQGVFYRASAFEEAQRLGLVGWVRNVPDGHVEAVVEGPRPHVEDFVAWCRRGPPAAQVSDVHVVWRPPTGEFRTFRIEK